MFPQHNRLTPEQIQQVFQSRFLISQLAILYTHQTNLQTDPQGAIVVGKKVSKRAVKRNYLKRVARNITIQNLSKLKKGLCFIIVLKPEAENACFADIKKDIEHLFKTSGSININ